MRIMAAKKTKIVYRTKKTKKKSKPPAKPLATAAGAALSVGDAATASTTVGASPLAFAKAGELGNVVPALKENAMKLDTYKALGAGVLISGSKRIPGVRILARPLDRMIKGFTGGKWGL